RRIEKEDDRGHEDRRRGARQHRLPGRRRVFHGGYSARPHHFPFPPADAGAAGPAQPRAVVCRDRAAAGISRPRAAGAGDRNGNEVAEILIRPARSSDLGAIKNLVRSASGSMMDLLQLPHWPLEVDYAQRIAAGTTWVLDETNQIAGLLDLNDHPTGLLLE